MTPAEATSTKRMQHGLGSSRIKGDRSPPVAHELGGASSACQGTSRMPTNASTPSASSDRDMASSISIGSSETRFGQDLTVAECGQGDAG